MMAEPGTHQMAVATALQPGGCMTTAELAAVTGLERGKVSNACSRLVERGWISRREAGCFALSADGAAALARGDTITSGPRGTWTQSTPRINKRKTERDRIWHAIRVVRKFTLAELEELAEAGRANVVAYVRHLRRAGYISELRRQPGLAPTSNGFGRYILVDDTGPLAPIYRQKTGDVHDRNTGCARTMAESSR